MSRKTFLRSTAVAASAALVAGLGAFAIQPAQAAIIGGATFQPATGNANTLLSIQTDGPCAAHAVKVRVKVFGFGFPANGQTVYSPQTTGFSTSSPMSLSVSNSFKIYATNNASTPLVGDYDVRVQCVDNGGNTVIDEFRNKMTWDTPGNSFANIDSATSVSVPVATPAIATTTTLAATPASPQQEPDYGVPAAVNLTASIDAGATDPTSGTVDFFNGATKLNASPVAVNGSSQATLSGIDLPVGNYSLTARYSGISAVIGDFSNNGTAGSVSAPVAYQVTAKPAAATTTALTVTGSLELNTPVTLDAVVLPNNATGSVEFLDGATVLGTVPVAAGTAQYVTSALSLGSHTLKARFVSSDAVRFAGSESAPQTISIVFNGVSTNQSIQVDVPNGDLTISVTNNATVLLNASITADGSRFTGSAAINEVTIKDTRAGSKGWNANGQLSAFTYSGTLPAGGTVLQTADLGWQPVRNSVTGTQQVTAGPTVAPGQNGTGLAVSRQLATSPLGASTGTAKVGATLNLNAPTTLAPGTHTATLTLTAI